MLIKLNKLAKQSSRVKYISIQEFRGKSLV